MIVDDRTSNLLLPLPNVENPLDADVERLRDALTALDAEVAGKVDAVDLSAKADLVAGKVPASQLPSYVDDVLNFASLAQFPLPGEVGKIYIAEDTDQEYRWNAPTSSYRLLSKSPGSTDAVPEGSTNKYFTDARARAAQQPATAAAAGVVKAGAGVAVAGDGTISVPVPSTVGLQVYQAASQAAARSAIGAGTGNSNFSGAYTDLSGKPTTLAGYGITNFKIESSGNADMNTLVTAGAYRFYSSAANMPPGVIHSIVFVDRGEDTGSQRVIDYLTGVMFTRGFVDQGGGTIVWSIWRRQLLGNEPQIAVSGTAIDLSRGYYFTDAVSVNKSYTFTNQVPGSSFTLEVTHTGGAISFPAIYPGGTAPSLTVNRRHLFFFQLPSYANAWLCYYFGNYAL